MSGPEWRFARRSASDVEHDPTEADQFNSEDVKLEQALIREATQNSQDASRSGDQPVRVRLSTVQGAELDAALLDEMTQPLLPRLVLSGIEDSTAAAKSALIVEDFGTTGLTGDPTNDADKGSFRSFWFRHGRSFKSGGNGGRWGLGKLVFPMSSAMRCHFGLTVRDGESGGLLLGQAVLKTHTLDDGTKYAPHGHWGLRSGEEIAPVTDEAFLKRFRDGFGLQRGGESGLSVVVPRPRLAPDIDELTRYVVLNYAFPILTGRLTFDVMGTVVDAASVRGIGATLLKPGLIEFIDSIEAAAEADLFPVPAPVLDNQTFQIREDTFDPAHLQELRKRYADGDRVGLRVPLQLRRKSDSAAGASFIDVHLKAAAEDEKSVALCVRGEITVPGEAARFQADTHFALLAAQDPLVSEFLGDAENPAHTFWSHEAERFKARWRDYPSHKLRLIRTSVGILHRLLATGQPQKDEKALLEFFWVDDPAEGAGGDTKPKPRRKGKVVFVKPTPPGPSKRMLNITQVAGGFTITQGPDFGERARPARLRVEMAYDMGGDAFKSWSPFDFDLGDGEEILIEVDGATRQAHGRRVDLDIEGEAFRLNLSGFDPRRDLVVKTSWPKGAGVDA